MRIMQPTMMIMQRTVMRIFSGGEHIAHKKRVNMNAVMVGC